MIPISAPLFAGNELEYVRDCIATGWVSSAGRYVTRFERAWADYCGMKHGVAVSSGTAALQVAVDALRLGPGDEVIMPAFTINIKLTESPIIIVKNSSHQRRASDQDVASPGPVHAFQHSFA